MQLCIIHVCYGLVRPLQHRPLSERPFKAPPVAARTHARTCIADFELGSCFKPNFFRGAGFAGGGGFAAMRGRTLARRALMKAGLHNFFFPVHRIKIAKATPPPHTPPQAVWHRQTGNVGGNAQWRGDEATHVTVLQCPCVTRGHGNERLKIGRTSE